MASYLPSTFRTPRSKLATLFVMVVLTLLVGGLLLRHPSHSLRVTACFQDVNGLNTPAFVRIAGVDVGRVLSVRAQPNSSTCPASVEMELQTEYPIRLHIDAVASVNTSGFLGSQYVAIDATHASGRPVENGGQIKSQENPPLTAAGLERIVKGATEILKEADETSGAPPSRKPAGGQRFAPTRHSN